MDDGRGKGGCGGDEGGWGVVWVRKDRSCSQGRIGVGVGGAGGARAWNVIGGQSASKDERGSACTFGVRSSFGIGGLVG